MLRQVRVDKSSVSQSAESFGFSRPSYYQAQAAFEEAGLAGLVPEKRGPRQGHKLTPEVLEFVKQTRADQPSLKPADVARLIEERFARHVHPRSIRRALLQQKKTALKYAVGSADGSLSLRMSLPSGMKISAGRLWEDAHLMEDWASPCFSGRACAVGWSPGRSARRRFRHWRLRRRRQWNRFRRCCRARSQRSLPEWL